MALRTPRQIHQYRGNRLTSAPGAEPITLAELKTHLRITGTDDDDYLTQLIEDARQELEDTTGIALITQSWQLTLDRWPGARERWWDGEVEGHPDILYGPDQAAKGSVYLPRYPLVSVDTVTVYDEDSNSSAVTIADVFDIDTQSQQGRMTLQRGAVWPIALRGTNAIEIVYTAGYGNAATDVPAPIKRALRQMAAYMYEHRGDGCEPKDAYVHSGAKAVMDRYRLVEV